MKKVYFVSKAKEVIDDDGIKNICHAGIIASSSNERRVMTIAFNSNFDNIVHSKIK